MTSNNNKVDTDSAEAPDKGVGCGAPVSVLDRDGFPPCTMTVDEMCAHLREVFGDRSFRVVAFKVRAYDGHCTLTSARGVMAGKRVTKAQAEAVKQSHANNILGHSPENLPNEATRKS